MFLSVPTRAVRENREEWEFIHTYIIDVVFVVAYNRSHDDRFSADIAGSSEWRNDGRGAWGVLGEKNDSCVFCCRTLFEIMSIGSFDRFVNGVT